MRAINIYKYGRFPQLIQLPIPSLDSDQVLVRMKYAPVNPSDVNFFQGRYGVRKQGTPTVGFEGAGVIQQAADRTLIGRKVSVIANMHNGTHASHIKSSLKQLIFWPEEVSLQQISMAWINPFSCMGMLQQIKDDGAENILLSAAASQLSRMIIKTSKKFHPQINIYGMTRSDAKNDELLGIGAKKIFPILEGNCEQVTQLVGKTAFFDCIGGNFAGRVFNKLPPHSIMKNYGRLSGQPLGSIDLSQLYFKDKSISGFWLNTWFKKISQQQLQNHKKHLVQHFNQIYGQKLRQIVPLKDFMDAYRLSIKDQSNGKILLDLQ